MRSEIKELSINQLEIYDHTFTPMTSSLSMSEVLYLQRCAEISQNHWYITLCQTLP
ncbi:unnamed protein product [Leuciscus chuanchicus]